MGQTLHAQLRNEQEAKEEFAVHKFAGTLYHASKNKTAPNGIKNISSFRRSKDFRDRIVEADVIVYDLMNTEFEEVDFVIKTLQTCGF
jgi:hypothetical protein